MTGALRVIQWGTGNTGSHALRFLHDDPAFEVVGVWARREQNIGRTAGELAGRQASGVAATDDVDALVGLDADCVVYMPAEPTRSPATPGTDGWDSVEIICRLLATGKNVVATGISGLTNPRTYGDDVHQRLADATEAGQSTFFGTGIEPGFMCDALALSLTSVSRHIRSIRVQEVISYATYDQPSYHVSRGGIWGSALDSRFADSFGPRILAAGMGAPVLLLAEALGVHLQDLAVAVELAPAHRDFEVPIGPIREGTTAGYRFEVRGIVDGTPAIVVEHVTRLHPEVAPDWPQLDPGGFRVMIEGRPSFTAEVVFDEDDPNIAGCTGTAARAVNSIPVVCSAPTGVCSFVDLPMIHATGIAG